MDNHSFSNTIHVFIGQHPDNDDDDTEDMPALVPVDARGSQLTQQAADVEMNGKESNILPLRSLSDPLYEDHDNNHDSESDRDAHEVELQTMNHRSLTDHAVSDQSASHTSQDQPAVNNRRARVEDDEDEDRDRRHPSQRIGNSANAMSSAGASSSSTSPQVPTAAPTPGVRLRGQAPIFSRTVIDEATTARTHPFRFFQHLMSNNNNNNNDNDNNDPGNTNPVLPSGGPIPGPVPVQGNTPHNQPHGHFESFSLTLDIGLGPAFPIGGRAQPPEGQPTLNAADPNLNANPNAQNAQNPNNLPGINIADFMARLGQAIGLGENGAEGTAAGTAAADGNNPTQGAGGAGPTPGAQFEFNVPVALNLGNLAGLGFGFNLDGNGFGEKEDPERARKLVDGLEEVPVGLVRRLERVGGTGGGMGEDETKGGDGGCAICWDRLLGSAEEDVCQHEECEKKEEESDRIPKAIDEASKRKIVSLPCAHVFHAECLIPWFSRPRQTTCPTCRFNIDPENLTYVSWRRRTRERRERERAEARARDDSENTNGNAASQHEIAPPAAATAAEPAVAPLFDAASASDQGLSFLSSESRPLRSRTPDAPEANVHFTPTPRSHSQPPASSSTPVPSSSQPMTQAAHDWDSMPGLEDVSDSEDEDEEDEDQDEDQDEDDESGDGVEEQEVEHGVQAPPLPPIASTPGAQAQAPTPSRQNDPLAARIQTTHGLVTFIPVPFNFPFPAAGNGVGVGVQAGGNGDYSHSSLELPQFDPVFVAANANPQVPPAAGQGPGQLPNINAHANTQGEYMRLVTRPDIHVPPFFSPLFLFPCNISFSCTLDTLRTTVSPRSSSFSTFPRPIATYA
jgi:Ring finger domain